MFRIFILLCILLSTNTGIKAQNISKAEWDWQKKWFDSIARQIDTNPQIENSDFTGVCSAGSFNAVCFYNKAKKEILKIRYTFTEDSIGVKTFYYNIIFFLKSLTTIPFIIQQYNTW